MTMLRMILYYVAYFIPFVLLPQSHIPFIELLSDDVEQNIMEQRIDSFFRVSVSELSVLELAECYHDRAGRWHYAIYGNTNDNKELDKAIYYAQKALTLKRQLPQQEKCAINRTLFNLGLFHYKKGVLDTALSFFSELIRKGKSYCGDERGESLITRAHYFATNVHLEMGDYHQAKNLITGMIEIVENNQNLDEDLPFWAYYGMAEVHKVMDVFLYSEQIAHYLSKAQNYIDENGFDCCYYQNWIDQLDGNRLAEIGNFKLSVEKHQQVVDHLDKGDSTNLAIAHNSLGESYFKVNEPDKAVYHLEKAIKLNKFYDSPYNNLGDIYTARGQNRKALDAYQQAINKAIDKKINLYFNQLPSLEQVSLAPLKVDLLNHLIYKAKGWIAYNEVRKSPEKIKMALATIELADKLVDIIKRENHEYQSKLYWREQGSQLYAQAVKLSYLLHDHNKAYYFMERNKALLLLEDLTQEDAKVNAQIPEDLAQREFNLRRSIFLAENLLYETDYERKASIDSLKSIISESKYRYQQFIDSLNQAYPDYAKYKKEANILTFNELNSNYISDEQVVLHYILNEEDGYGLLTSADGPILFQLENTAQLNNDIDSLTSLLSSGISDITTFNTTSNTLFKNLIPAEIYEKIKGKQLIIVPDYTLQRIPFETLVVDKAKTKYLIEDVEIAYVYSMSLLDHNKGSARNHSKQLLGLAPIHFDNLKLAELSYSESEIAGIAPFFDGDIFLNDQASKANFLKEVATPKIIHLATHADMGDGENPWIAFSDEKMYLKEIYATKNQSEMVVLSACNTLSGDLKRGEGVMSLARGFFYSGAKSVVSSLWPLTDEAGSDIMISFYQNLDKGHSKSKALRQAKLDYMNSNIVEELKHPFYWAGFVVVGDNAPLVASRNPVWIIGIVLVLAILYLFRRKFLKRLQ